jgi:hypothetical protein
LPKYTKGKRPFLPLSQKLLKLEYIQYSLPNSGMLFNNIEVAGLKGLFNQLGF